MNSYAIFYNFFGSASIWVIIPVPFHPAVEYLCPKYIGVGLVEHTPLDGLGLIDRSL